MSAFRDAIARSRQTLNPLSTQLPPAHQQYQTPATAVGGSLSSPFGYHVPPATYTPVSAVRTYNPQQWGPATHSLSPEQQQQQTTHYALRNEEGVETPAPPPYSPPRSRPPAQQAFLDAASPAPRASPAVVHRPSPEPQAAPVFAPPPGSRNRTSSRDRPQPLFNLSAITRRMAGPDPNSVSPPVTRDQAAGLHRPHPIHVGPIQPTQPTYDIHDTPARPPASRRAASTGAIPTPPTSHQRQTSTVTARWEPGMPLPPPPPCPPPQASSRSQSVTRMPNDPIASPPTRRPQALQSFSTLGPVPPTPADWVDEDAAAQGRGRSPHRPLATALTINTAAASAGVPLPPPPPRPLPAVENEFSTSPPNPASESSFSNTSPGLSRNPAVRGEPRSIRERRSESKQGRRLTLEEQNRPTSKEGPSDISVPPTTTLTRRTTITKSTPRSGRMLDTPNSARTDGTDTPILNPPGNESRGSTPRPPSSSHRIEAPTPPFSPDSYQPTSFPQTTMGIPPRSLPTPPPQHRRSESITRGISSVLHHGSNTDPLSPPNRAKAGTPVTSPISDFILEAIERHSMFAKMEESAPTDEERVRVFAEYIVTESRLHRERYAAAMSAMGSEVLELTRDLFRPYTRAEREALHQETTRRQSNGSDQPRSARILALQIDASPQSRPGSAGIPVNMRGNSPPRDSPYYNNTSTAYKPSLSPIASMTAASDAPDESSSRGRPSIRWWEAGYDGPSSPTAASKLERSKRESKYMGVPREAREQLQWEVNTPASAMSEHISSAAASGNRSSYGYGPNEYPPEKVGWHEEIPQRQHTPMATSTPNAMMSPNSARTNPHVAMTQGETPTSAGFLAQRSPYLSTPSIAQSMASPPPPTPQSSKPAPQENLLDVSRLVTLPPPYPRHHPAVNNSHPDLADIRSALRVLSDLSSIKATQENFNTTATQNAELAVQASRTRRKELRARCARMIETGEMSYSDAAREEKELEATEGEEKKKRLKEEFEAFQREVVGPVNEALMKRAERAGELFEEVCGKLFPADPCSGSPSDHASFTSSTNLTPSSSSNGNDVGTGAGTPRDADTPRATPTPKSAPPHQPDRGPVRHPEPQEEGDEQPELLEKLTLLKWIFEAREVIQRSIFSLLSSRNSLYKSLVLLPYQLAGNQAKVESAERFFALDELRRKGEEEKEAMRRATGWGEVVERNVHRGVEVQLGAFWDVAVGIKPIIDGVPRDLDSALCVSPDSGGEPKWGLVIPKEEMAENPQLERWPLQYLWQVVGHAERATYQFVESQVNLWCLLHEVRVAVLQAEGRVERAEAASASQASASPRGGAGKGKRVGEMGGDERDDMGVANVDDGIERRLKREEERLTDDLKEKVRVVEGLWRSALGDEIEGVKGRVREFLIREGGWEGVEDEV